MNTTPVSLEDASLNTWVHPVDGTAYIYYPKGSLAGLMLDIMIRDASDNKQSLDDVMRGLYESTYKHGRGFTPTDWWNAVTCRGERKIVRGVQRAIHRRPRAVSVGQHSAHGRAPRATGARSATRCAHPAGRERRRRGERGRTAARRRRPASNPATISSRSATSSSRTSSSAPSCARNTARRRRAHRCRSRFGAGPTRCPSPGKLQFGPGDTVVEAEPVGIAKGDENSRRNSEGRRRSIRRGSRVDRSTQPSRREVGGERGPRPVLLRRLTNELRHRVERIAVLDRNRDARHARGQDRVWHRALRREDQQIAVLVVAERRHGIATESTARRAVCVPGGPCWA